MDYSDKGKSCRVKKICNYLVSMARADSIGVRSRLVMSSFNNSGQWSRKLCIADKAPARPSSVTCQVKASPRAFSLSSSLVERGKEFLQSKSIRGKRPLTTAVPRVIIAPIRSQPACVRFKDNRLFWLALRSNSSAVLKIILPLVWGTPSGDKRTLPRTAARALLYPAIASGELLMFSIPSTQRSINGVIWLGTATHMQRRHQAAASLAAWQGCTKTVIVVSIKPEKKYKFK